VPRKKKGGLLRTKGGERKQEEETSEKKTYFPILVCFHKGGLSFGHRKTTDGRGKRKGKSKDHPR